jgi:LAO/AO transport system kinase
MCQSSHLLYLLILYYSYPNIFKLFDPDINQVFDKLKDGDKVFLARAITWIESTNKNYRQKALDLLQLCKDLPTNSLKIAVTGPPGVGKSTLIEAIGLILVERGHQVAVLAVDPSSEQSRGSILGDKTRMNLLGSHTMAFVRPSPSGMELGGVNQTTRESILLCEAAGFDIIFIETVGVGQSEVEVKDMTDLLLLLLNPGGGDDLQGIKKGIMEAADIIAITKYDHHLIKAGDESMTHVRHSLRIKSTDGQSIPDIITVSAETNHNVERLISLILQCVKQRKDSGEWQQKRLQQEHKWFKLGLLRRLSDLVAKDEIVQHVIDDFISHHQVADNSIPIAIEKELLKLKDRFLLKE